VHDGFCLPGVAGWAGVGVEAVGAVDGDDGVADAGVAGDGGGEPRWGFVVPVE